MAETEIPEDVMKAADEYTQAIVDCAWAAGEPLNQYLNVYIARAILAERERCAKVAESAATSGDFFAGVGGEDLRVLAAGAKRYSLVAAAAIRASSP